MRHKRGGEGRGGGSESNNGHKYQFLRSGDRSNFADRLRDDLAHLEVFRFIEQSRRIRCFHLVRPEHVGTELYRRFPKCGQVDIGIAIGNAPGGQVTPDPFAGEATTAILVGALDINPAKIGVHLTWHMCCILDASRGHENHSFNELKKVWLISIVAWPARPTWLHKKPFDDVAQPKSHNNGLTVPSYQGSV